MTRAIKFRAWDEDNKRMGMVRAIDWNEDQIITSHLEFKNGDVEKVYPEETVGDHIRYMQFTGLLDKNGKEIYEGDILRGLNGGSAIQVYWDATMAAFYVKSGNENFDDLLEGYTQGSEIIGNTYENPELLNPKEV